MWKEVLCIITPGYYIITFLVASIHSFLNFKLCGILSDGTRFHKRTIYFVCVLNGLVSCNFLITIFDSPMTFYFLASITILLELLLLFEGRFTAIYGVAVGSLLHLFVLRSAIVAITAMAKGISMQEVIFSSALLPWVNLGAYAAQIATLIMFITLIPMPTLKSIMENKGFYTQLLTLTTILTIYMIYNSNVFLEDYISVNLAVQELVISIAILLFFYIMMLQQIMIFNLGVYKTKTEELEQKIGQDQQFTSAIFNFAEMIVEINCSQDRLRRLVINSIEKPIEEIQSVTGFFIAQSKSFTHPDDLNNILGITSESLISDFEKGIEERVFDYRSKSFVSSDYSTQIRVESDKYLWYRMRINTSRDRISDEIIAILTVHEIHEEKQEEIELRQKAETDLLTGAYNKNTFAHKVQEHLNEGMHGTLYMLDLDNFKGINDNMGHSSGDEVLCMTYGQISSIFREHDLVGRIGGDEFMVFLLGTTKQSIVVEKAKKILEVLHNVYHAENGVDIEVSSSIGIAMAPQDGTNFDSLYNATDLAMYQSKSVGKNTYTIYDSGQNGGFKPQEKEAYMRLGSTD